MIQCRVQEHEAVHLDDLRHLDEDERRILYRIAHRWRKEHDRDALQVAIVVPLKSVGSTGG